MGKTISEEMNEIFSEIKKEGYITAVVLLTNDGLRAGCCDYFDDDKELANTYAAHVSIIIRDVDGLRCEIEDADETSRIGVYIGSKNQDESIHLIIEKINDDYTLLAEYRWENLDKLENAYNKIDQYAPKLKNILERQLFKEAIQ